MDIQQKSTFSVHDDKFTLTMPIAKVDKEHRIVSGFATLNNVDKQRDIVDAAASRKAFEEWAGNVRMMHDKIPAGRAVDIMEKQFTDDDGNTFDGVWVDVYISKGAPNVWEMVLDETLRGFSIQGKVNDYTMRKFDGKQIRYITDYTLNEVSLVDNPANQFATIMSIQKSGDGVSITSIYEPSESSVTMEEEGTTMSLLKKILAIVQGANVEKATVQPDTSTVVQPDVRQADDAARDDDGVYTGTAGGSDLGTPDEPEGQLLHTDDEQPAVVEKMLSINDELKSLTASVATVAQVVEQLATRIAGLEKSTDRRDITKSLDEIVDRLKAVELETAHKQSGDIAKSTVYTPRQQQSFWDGAILSKD